MSTIDNIRKGNGKFQYGEDICKKSICELNELINTCNKRKIQLILVFPPLSKVVLNELENNPNHKYFPKIKNEIQKITMKSNIELWFYDLDILKLSDSYMLDGFHPSEVVYANILCDIFEKNSQLKSIINYNILKEKINQDNYELNFN